MTTFRPPTIAPLMRPTRNHPGGRVLDGPATGLAFLRAAPFAVVALTANVILPGSSAAVGPLALILLWLLVPTAVALGMRDTWRTDGSNWVAQRTFLLAWRKVDLNRTCGVLEDKRMSMWLLNASSIRISDSRGGWVRVTDQRGWGPEWTDLMGRKLKERGWQKALMLDQAGYGVYQELSGDRRSLRRHQEVYGTNLPLIAVSAPSPAAQPQYHRADGSVESTAGRAAPSPAVALSSPTAPVPAPDASRGKELVPTPELASAPVPTPAPAPAPAPALDRRAGGVPDRRADPVPVLVVAAPYTGPDRRLPRRPEPQPYTGPERRVLPSRPGTKTPYSGPERRLPNKPAAVPYTGPERRTLPSRPAQARENQPGPAAE